MKNKYDYSFDENELKTFKNNIYKELQLHTIWNDAQLLIIPETSNEVLISIAKNSGKEVVFLIKNSKENILLKLQNQKMMKSEAKKLFSIVEGLDIVKMAAIAGNQRKRFISILFKELNLSENQKDKNILFFDDSLFSGFTYLAAQDKIKELKYNTLFLYSKM